MYRNILSTLIDQSWIFKGKNNVKTILYCLSNRHKLKFYQICQTWSPDFEFRKKKKKKKRPQKITLWVKGLSKWENAHIFMENAQKCMHFQGKCMHFPSENMCILC